MPLNTPYAGHLVDLRAAPEAAAELKAYAGTLPSVQLTLRSACDLELLATGAFSPLDRFMGAADYRRVLGEMRLASGVLFPIPITLPIHEQDAEALALDQDVTLRDAKNNLLAVMRLEELYRWDADEAAQQVLGTRDSKHPLVAEMARWGAWFASGALRVLALPVHYDFRDLRLTPAQTRAALESRLAASGKAHVVAFQTRNPLHRAHEELTKRAAAEADAVLLLHPVVGLTRPGDVDHYTRVRTYKALIQHHYPPESAMLALLPLAMRMAGPREAVWHAIIRRNHGATHFIVGRDHAGPGSDSNGTPFYGPYDAQALVHQHADEIGITLMPFAEMHYLPDENRYAPADEVPPGAHTVTLSGTQVREQYLNIGRALPTWFTRPETAAILAEANPPRYQQGVCVWFTGLSGSGKSTTAEIVSLLLLEYGRRTTVLDGDVVRTHLSKGLGFSKEDRDTNILRIGFVASEIVRHGGIVICAAISPYAHVREQVRQMVGSDQFIEVFVDTPIEECERRDVKGMYAKARRGEITGFTGVDDPYEPPPNPEIVLETLAHTAEDNARRVVDYLLDQGFLRADLSIALHMALGD
jgi:sulfate adenylyltransferase